MAIMCFDDKSERDNTEHIDVQIRNFKNNVIEVVIILDPLVFSLPIVFEFATIMVLGVNGSVFSAKTQFYAFFYGSLNTWWIVTYSIGIVEIAFPSQAEALLREALSIFQYIKTNICLLTCGFT